MEVRLVVTNDNANAKQVRLGSETVIGRSRECNLRIASGQVSRQHCMIRVEDSRVLVRDLGSANGTEVDGVTIPPEIDIPVAPGSSLVVGPLKFVFEFTPDPPKELNEDEELQSTTEDISPIPCPFPSKVSDEETKDYGPSLNRQRRTLGLGGDEEPDSGQLDFMEGQPSSPVALVGGSREFPPEGSSTLSSDETVFDRDLAGRARDAGLPPGGIGHGLESGTDLLAEGQGGFDPQGSTAGSAKASPDDTGTPVDALGEPNELNDSRSEGTPPRKGWKVFGLLQRGERPGGKGTKAGSSPKKTSSKDSPPEAADSAASPAPEEDADLHDFFRKFEP